MAIQWRRGPYQVPEGYTPGIGWRRQGNLTGRYRPQAAAAPGYVSEAGRGYRQAQRTPASWGRMPSWYTGGATGYAPAGVASVAAPPSVPAGVGYPPQQIVSVAPPAQPTGGGFNPLPLIGEVVQKVQPYYGLYKNAAQAAAEGGLVGGPGSAPGGAAGAGAGVGAQYEPAPRGVPAGWYRQFQQEHGETPEQFYGRTGEGLDEAWADKQFGDEFYRQYGRAPNEQEWEENWYQTRRGHGRPVFSPEQWAQLRKLRKPARYKAPEQVAPRIIPNPVRWRTWGG